MLKITEEFLHFIWKNQSLTGILLESEKGSNIQVLDPGMHNMDSGPDFFNSKISIDGTTWEILMEFLMTALSNMESHLSGK